MKKAQLGQFFTTNTEYILQNMAKYVADKEVSDPFAGNQDLLRWADEKSAKSTIGFDVDSHYVDNVKVFYNDSLKNPKKYKFVLTNPPYLYQNKMEDNSILAGSKHTDLYQLSLERIADSDEGIVIVPVNFLSAENAGYIRRFFFERFDIVEADYFTEQVFGDTTYNVMAFYYRRKAGDRDDILLPLRFRPDDKIIDLRLSKRFDWRIGGEFLSGIRAFKNRLNIRRLEEKDLSAGPERVLLAFNHVNTVGEYSVSAKTKRTLDNNVVLLKAIDSGTEAGKIGLENIKARGIEGLVSIKTSRNQIHLLFPDFVTVEEQEKLIVLFNEELNKARETYGSLFMTNFRDNDRKRISFNFAYDFLNYLYFTRIRV